MSTAPDPFIGRTLLNGQFQVLQKIGSGGMGSVYKASQPAMNRMVAIKILHPKHKPVTQDACQQLAQARFRCSLALD